MRNKVEILRSIQFSKEDLNNIKNLNEVDTFTDKDVEFMDEFKKIYELGLNQLELFINKLDAEGSELDVFTIKYYVSNILNGPLAKYAIKLAEGKKYFLRTPNSMGTCGNVEITSSNTSHVENTDHPLGVNVDTYNKLPQFMQSTLTSSVKITEEVFRSGIKATLFMDNTLPIVDKRPQARYNSESTGGWQKTSHGSFCVADTDFKNVLKAINPVVFSKVKSLLGDENFRLFADNKSYNAFDNVKNTSTSNNYIFKQQLKEGDTSIQEIDMDILGSVNDSFDRRTSSLKIENPDKVVEYALNTNKGQLGIK